MVISREPKTCFKLKSGSSKKPVLIIGRWGIKENERSREGCFRDFYTYNSFFPLENNELVKLIFNSEPPHIQLTWTDFQVFEFYTIFAFLSPLCVTAIVDRKIDYYFSIAIYKFPFFALLQLGFKIVGSDREEDSYPLKLAPRFTKSRSRVWLPLIGKPRAKADWRRRGCGGLNTGEITTPRSAIRGFRKRVARVD